MMTEQEFENWLVQEYMAKNNWVMPDTRVPDADYSDLEFTIEEVKWFIARFKQAGYVQLREGDLYLGKEKLAEQGLVITQTSAG